MHIILIIFGVLLLLFGGGCTLIVLAMIFSDPNRIGSSLALTVPYWIPLGLLPLIMGWLLLRSGLKSRRAKREEK